MLGVASTQIGADARVIGSAAFDLLTRAQLSPIPSLAACSEFSGLNLQDSAVRNAKRGQRTRGGGGGGWGTCGLDKSAAYLRFCIVHIVSQSTNKCARCNK